MRGLAPVPGSRVLIRNEEWIVRNVEQCDVGGHQLECIGVSETVRHRDAVFFTEIDTVRILDPKDTELTADPSPRYMASLLYLEARLRQTVPTDSAIALGNRGAMDTLPFQLEPTRRVLEQLRPRFLIADAVGLGKTLEAGVLVSELMRRGKGRRILVVTTKKNWDTKKTGTDLLFAQAEESVCESECRRRIVQANAVDTPERKAFNGNAPFRRTSRSSFSYC